MCLSQSWAGHWCGMPAKYMLTIPLTARLISISSKSLWSSMAATSQRYSAVSARVVLKIRMLAGSLSWALCSKSPFERERKKTLYNCSFKYTTWLHSSTTDFDAKFFEGIIHAAKLWALRHCFEMLWSRGWWGFQKEPECPSGLPAILFWKYT